MNDTTVLADSWHVWRVPVGDWIKAVIDWLTDNLKPLFDFIAAVVSDTISWLTDVLTVLPPWGMIIVFALLALVIRGWNAALFTVLGFGLIDGMRLFDETMETLAQVAFSAVIAIIIAIPLGIAASRSPLVSRMVRPVMDFLQTLPVFVYLIPAVALFHIGTVPGVVATVAFSVPPGVRLTELGIRQVDPEMVEAGEAFGASPRGILTGIQLPLALPSIMAGINQVIMLALSMQVVAGMVGGPGLGKKVFQAVTTVKVGLGFEAGLAVVILAVYLDRLSAVLGNRSTSGRIKDSFASMWRAIVRQGSGTDDSAVRAGGQ